MAIRVSISCTLHILQSEIMAGLSMWCTARALPLAMRRQMAGSSQGPMGEGNPNSEGRNPKEARRSKSEASQWFSAVDKLQSCEISDFGLRASFGFRPSEFGF